MRPGLGQVQERALVRPVPEDRMPTAVAATVKEIPYDYVARFMLKGIRGNREQDVINISIEGAFVAVAIGYSFIPAPLPNRDPELGALVAEVAGIKPSHRAVLAVDIFLDPRMLIQCLLARLCGIDFKYSIVDSGTGRELQNQPIHNISGLGKPDGDRPFRPLAKPMLFMPRSTIRIEVEEISQGFIYGYEDPTTKRRVGAELFIALHGYKILGFGTGLP